MLRVFDSNGRCHGKGKLCLTAIALMFDRVRAHHTSAAYVRFSEPVVLFLWFFARCTAMLYVQGVKE